MSFRTMDEPPEVYSEKCSECGKVSTDCVEAYDIDTETMVSVCRNCADELIRRCDDEDNR